jgi:hypothetical protein
MPIFSQVLTGYLLLQDPIRSLPLLRAAFTPAPTKQKAKTLCLLGDTAGVAWLTDYLAVTPLGTGLEYSSTLRNITDIDGIIWALGLAGDARAVPALAAKLDSCGLASTDFSHLRALLTALGRIGSPLARQSLHKFLSRSGVTGYHKLSTDANAHTTATELKSYIELFGAAALYRSGDTLEVSRTILENYLNDWRGILVRYAGYVLGVDSTVYTVAFTPQERLNRRSLAVFPNPFNRRINLELPLNMIGTSTRVTVTDLSGQIIRRIPVTAEECVWDGLGADGTPVTPGIYLLQVATPRETIVRRIVLSR